MKQAACVLHFACTFSRRNRQPEPLFTCHLAALKITFSGAHTAAQRKQNPYRAPGLVSHDMGHRKSPGELPVAQKPHKVRGWAPR